ncbi:sin3 histone deacetylase corepressor complex component SDS3-like [Styela clava]|uniref:sin3 histone deacetylase corepressor complex component SDS3-like n=1 Tax=Styela clava TaxID=7725 RepID=UPI00193991EA|nr:sin3 histone deacetylase corepressor complex component SDS3-like [Styela clava]
MKKMSEEDEYDSFDDEKSPKNSEGRSSRQSRGHDEDTDDASETDRAKFEEEALDQIYRDKLGQLKKQLAQLDSGTLQEYCKRLKKLEQVHKDRQRQAHAHQEYLLYKVEQEYEREKKAAMKDFDEKKVELKENLIAELQEKKKMIESERHTMELTGVCPSMGDAKTQVKRNLRRRAHDPAPANNDKRRKPSPTQLNFVLDDEEILEDLKIINKGKPAKLSHEISVESHNTSGQPVEARIEGGKLLYDKKWYHRGQPVFIYNYKDNTKFSGVITVIADREITIRKTSGVSVRIFASQLHRGKYGIKKRMTQ